MPNSQNVCKAPPIVLPCKCETDHDFQDRRYGRKRRLYNPTAKKADRDGPRVYRCTVCSLEVER